MNMAYIADSTKTLKAKTGWSSYTNGRDGNPVSLSKIKVKVPTKGYLVLEISDGNNQGEVIYAKTT